MKRASLSVVLNIAESAGRRSPADRAHIISIARGSAMECGAVIDVAMATALVTIGAAREVRGLVVRIVQMLTKLEASNRNRVGC
ncbi:MAG: four helix bundle protein [Vicinamibacteria bacterium]|nr:four helix bundle protein [Vicinamibacteria bacterium]